MSAAQTGDCSPEDRIEKPFQRWDLLQSVFLPLAALLQSIQIVSFPRSGTASNAPNLVELVVLCIALSRAVLRADLVSVCWGLFL